MTVGMLARELRVSLDDAAGYRRELDNLVSSSDTGHAARGQTALDLIQQRTGVTHIVTFCRELDDLLGGGVAMGEVTEFCGVPGAGKTQLCMQLALNAQIPERLGGAAGDTVYIDTEGSLTAVRMHQMATALHKHITHIARKRHSDDAAFIALCEARLQPEEMLRHVHVFRCTELVEQHAVVLGLHPFLDAHPEVRVIILDSVTFHYRYATEGDMAARARQLQATSQSLHRMAATYNVAVVVINHMTTRGMATGAASDAPPATAADGSAPMEGSGKLVPALGETWAHACTNRVLLGWTHDTRVADLVKSPSRKPGRVPFFVTADGFRGPKRSSTSAAAAAVAGHGVGSSGLAGTKRPRSADAP